ncbi:MAG TPA: DMT family transporter [Polyangium sp.]|nr:DMT family transporter [Polyangium sp.]
MPLPLGELAALGTACCWTASSLAFSAAGRRMGSLSLNLVRLVIAFCLLAILGLVRRGQPLPLDASPRTWGWLLASGFVGYVLGDICLFRAFVIIGPRLSMLLMALAPPIAAVLGFFFLNERISTLGLVGMAVTIAGVVWVVRERPDSSATNHTEAKGDTLRQGILLGLGAALGQAGGMALGKIGMGNYDPVASGQIRVLAGVLGFSAVFFIVGWWGKTRDAIRDKTALGYASIGAFMGPVLGVTLSLFAVQHTETGVAATIMSTTPVLLIPVVVLARLEKVTLRAGLGALIAVIGVAMLWVR